MNLIFVCTKDNEEKNQTGTDKIAKRIKALIKEKHSKITSRISKISDASSEKHVKERVRYIVKKYEHAHLNYTGGTKTMAALFFHYMKESYQKKYKYKLSSSYLDARTNAIIIDGKGSEALSKLSYCKLSLKELTKLHGYNNIEHDVYNYKKVLEKLSHMYEEHLCEKTKHTFFDKATKTAFKKSKLYSYLQGKKGIGKKEIDKSIKELGFTEIIDQICSEKNIEDLIELQNDDDVKIKINALLEGGWFEYFVLRQLEKRLEAKGESEINLYFDVRNTKDEVDKKEKDKEKEDKKDKKDTFQLDLVAIYGYQMTLISITTSDLKKTVKQKGFEAMHRARQISGSETKFVVVSFLKKGNLNALEEDFKLELGATFNRYKAVCLDDIKDTDNKSGKNIFDDIIEFIKK